MTKNYSFHAQVAPEAIEKVGRLFNASIDDILGELLQNSRRAGASRIKIDQITDAGFGVAIRVADDGAGLEDPKSLFSLGLSRWSKATAKSEDAAGMGFFALANRGATVIAPQKGTARSWLIEANVAAFHGERPVAVRSGPNDHAGMTVVFPLIASENVAGAVRHASRFFPIPVVFNGETMPSSDFLKDAVHVEEWRGIRVGIYRDEPLRHLGENANFHGVTLHIPLPELRQSWHSSYTARIEVVDCAYLKLVLPARKEVVRGAMYEALLEEIDRIYFRMVAASGAHSLSLRDYRRGWALGIDLPEAPPVLRPFSPSFAEADRNEYLAPSPLDLNAHIHEGGDPLQEQNLARAMARWSEAPKLFEPNAAFEGYDWYDRLPRIAVRSYAMDIGGYVEEIDPEGSFTQQGRPDRLEAVVEIGTGEAADIRRLETDLIVTGPEYGSLDDVDIRVAKQSEITPAMLQRFLTDTLFSPSGDVDAGSYDQQQEWFSDQAEDISIALLQSGANADFNAIVRAVERELVWRVPKTGSVVIRIDDGKVAVEGLPVPDSAADGSVHSDIPA